jgi:hypothetical protein
MSTDSLSDVEIESIVLTEHGETLVKVSGPMMPKGKLSHCIGIHKVCEGFVDIKPVSGTHQAVVCRDCGLRVVFSNIVTTYGQLKACSKRST